MARRKLKEKKKRIINKPNPSSYLIHVLCIRVYEIATKSRKDKNRFDLRSQKTHGHVQNTGAQCACACKTNFDTLQLLMKPNGSISIFRSFFIYFFSSFAYIRQSKNERIEKRQTIKRRKIKDGTVCSI